ncbi:MAG: chitobiase/beta-hexosaminidase C-terminal domain-containing protein [Kiritimatiellia bacterium]
MNTAVKGEGVLSFKYRVSSEAGYDFFTFFVDDVEVFRDSGESGWKQRDVAIQGAGKHILTWTYSKDAYDSEGADCTYVDSVVWKSEAVLEPDVVATPVTLPPDGTKFTTSSQRVIITCATEDAEIRYTTDGSAPTITDALYPAPSTSTPLPLSKRVLSSPAWPTAKHQFPSSRTPQHYHWLMRWTSLRS